MRRAITILFGLSMLAVVALAVSALCGSTGCMLSPSSNEMIWMLRVPRALAGFGGGGLLALAGALMQVLLRNPLADPYVLGLSGGAAAGALTAMMAALHLGISQDGAVG